jgi:hypothetical protein
LHLTTRLAFAGAFVLCGCADRAEFTTMELVGGVPAQVATACAGDCAQAVTAEISLEASESLPDDAFIEMHQLRVDYALSGIAEEVPFFASELAVTVVAGEASAFTFPAAGENQRSWVIDRFDGEAITGRATVTAIGYDDLNETIEVTAGFDISFGDYASDASESEE